MEGARGRRQGTTGLCPGLLVVWFCLCWQATWVHCTSLPFTADGETRDLVERCLDEALASGSSSSRGAAGDSAGGEESSGSGGKGRGVAKLLLDVNLPLLLWRSKAHAWSVLAPLWPRASVVELSRSEAEFLIGEEPYVRRRDARCLYAAETHSQLRAMHDDYHYSREEIAPLWERGVADGGALELLLITDGTVLVRQPSTAHPWHCSGVPSLVSLCSHASPEDAASLPFEWEDERKGRLAPSAGRQGQGWGRNGGA